MKKQKQPANDETRLEADKLPLGSLRKLDYHERDGKSKYTQSYMDLTRSIILSVLINIDNIVDRVWLIDGLMQNNIDGDPGFFILEHQYCCVLRTLTVILTEEGALVLQFL